MVKGQKYINNVTKYKKLKLLTSSVALPSAAVGAWMAYPASECEYIKNGAIVLVPNIDVSMLDAR